MRQRAGPGGDLPIVQEHEINVAVRVEFRPPITANGHQRQLRKFFLRLLGQAGFGRVPQVTQQYVENAGAPLANLAPAGPRSMRDFQPMRLDLEEGLIARQFLGRLPPCRQLQPDRRVCFNFFQQTLHSPASLVAKHC